MGSLTGIEKSNTWLGLKIERFTETHGGYLFRKRLEGQLILPVERQGIYCISEWRDTAYICPQEGRSEK